MQGEDQDRHGDEVISPLLSIPLLHPCARPAAVCCVCLCLSVPILETRSFPRPWSNSTYVPSVETPAVGAGIPQWSGLESHLQALDVSTVLPNMFSVSFKNLGFKHLFLNRQYIYMFKFKVYKRMCSEKSPTTQKQLMSVLVSFQYIEYMHKQTDLGFLPFP